MAKVDRDKIKEALDLFQDDDFVACREILKEEIHNHKIEYVNECIGLNSGESGKTQNNDEE